MSNRRGILYKDEEGNKYIAYNDKQDQAFKDAKKVLVHHITDDYKPKHAWNGKQLIGLKSASKLIAIGFTD